jgi:hypothetical protein
LPDCLIGTLQIVFPFIGVRNIAAENE